MILVDTSVWIDHLRHGNDELAGLLEQGEVGVHPFVVGELACGSLPRRAEVIALLKQLPATALATHEEALVFIDRHRLMGRGIGLVDVHLLASTLLTAETRLWTVDARLAAAASHLSVRYEPSPR